MLLVIRFGFSALVSKWYAVDVLLKQSMIGTSSCLLAGWLAGRRMFSLPPHTSDGSGILPAPCAVPLFRVFAAFTAISCQRETIFHMHTKLMSQLNFQKLSVIIIVLKTSNIKKNQGICRILQLLFLTWYAFWCVWVCVCSACVCACVRVCVCASFLVTAKHLNEFLRYFPRNN